MKFHRKMLPLYVQHQELSLNSILSVLVPMVLVALLLEVENLQREQDQWQ
jgi:hypothetical protein